MLALKAGRQNSVREIDARLDVTERLKQRLVNESGVPGSNLGTDVAQDLDEGSGLA